MRIIVSFFIGLILITGCSQSVGNNAKSRAEATHNPTAEEVLTQNADADIFQFQGIVYENADHVDWVQQEKLTSGERVGKITKPYQEGLPFEDGMATKLPEGAEIFEPAKKSGPVLIVKWSGNEKRYLGLLEG